MMDMGVMGMNWISEVVLDVYLLVKNEILML